MLKCVAATYSAGPVLKTGRGLHTGSQLLHPVRQARHRQLRPSAQASDQPPQPADPANTPPPGNQSPATGQPQVPVVPASSSSQQSGNAFAGIERLIAGNFNALQPGLRDDWQEVEGNWVLRPASGPAQAVVHFVGGAFVGAAPQLTYRLFLETLAARGLLVIATPYHTGFDHLRISDEIHYKFDRCMAALEFQVRGLPVYGIGHSMGSLQHLLINSRYATQRQGNVFMSFNNKPATEAIPNFSAFIAPGAQMLGPFLAQLAANPFATQLFSMTEVMRGLSPGLVKQVLPLVDQLTPLYMEVSQGRVEFSPHPSVTQSMAKSYYGTPRNLLLRFTSDNIDETEQLAALLQQSSVASSSTSTGLEMTVRNLPGDHVRPLRQSFGDLPPELAEVANQAASQGGQLLQGLSQMATQAGFAQASEPLDLFAKGLAGFKDTFGGNVGGDSTEALVDEIVEWLLPGSVSTTRAVLPSTSTRL